MTYHFTIPKPSSPLNSVSSRLATDPIKIWELVANIDTLVKSGIMHHYLEVNKYLSRFLKGSGLGDDSPANKTRSQLIQIISLIYIGKRIGAMGDSIQVIGETVETHSPVSLLSLCLTVLSAEIGENQAAEVFRRIQSYTEKVLAQQVQRSV